MRRLISSRGGFDRSLLQMTYRVMQHTRFRAQQVRDAALDQATDAMIVYVDAIGGPEVSNPAIIEAHFNAIRDLLVTHEPQHAQADAAPPRKALAG